MTTLIFTIFISMAISALCSLLEACLLSLSLTDIAKISEKKIKVAKIWENFKKNIDKPIAVILIVNTLAHTIGAALSGAQFEKKFGGEWIWLFSLIYSLAMIQWTEILPKTMGVKYNRNLADIFALPLNLLVTIFKPIAFIIHLINKPFEGKKDDRNFDALSEINTLAHFASLNNSINKDQEKIVKSAISLSKIKAKDIMVGVDEVKFLKTDMSMTEALVEAHIHHHTRLPLIEDNDIHNVIGYINFKDIVSALQINPENPSLRGISRPILFIDENENLSFLLNKLTKSYQHIAIVKNSDKKVIGLLTIEDLLETIVGEMDDEYDILPTYFYKITLNRYLLGGGINLFELKEKINIDVPLLNININDWLIELNKKVPKVEDKIRYKNIVFIIRKVSRSQINEIIVEIN